MALGRQQTACQSGRQNATLQPVFLIIVAIVEQDAANGGRIAGHDDPSERQTAGHGGLLEMSRRPSLKRVVGKHAQQRYRTQGFCLGRRRRRVELRGFIEHNGLPFDRTDGCGTKASTERLTCYRGSILRDFDRKANGEYSPDVPPFCLLPTLVLRRCATFGTLESGTIPLNAKKMIGQLGAVCAILTGDHVRRTGRQSNHRNTHGRSDR